MSTDEQSRLALARARYQEALAEIARLSQPDDHGSGERTARLSALGAWELVRDEARREVEAITGRAANRDA